MNKIKIEGGHILLHDAVWAELADDTAALLAQLQPVLALRDGNMLVGALPDGRTVNISRQWSPKRSLWEAYLNVSGAVVSGTKSSLYNV